MIYYSQIKWSTISVYPGACPIYYQRPGGGNRVHSHQVYKWHQDAVMSWCAGRQNSHRKHAKKDGKVDQQESYERTKVKSIPCENPLQCYHLGTDCLERQLCWKEAGVLVDSKLNMSQQGSLEPWKQQGNGARVLKNMLGGRMTSNRHKLKSERFRLALSRNFLLMKNAKVWRRD